MTNVRNSCSALIAEIEGAGGADIWAGRMNRQHSPSRPADAPHGPTKAAAVQDGAKRLRATRIHTAQDFLNDPKSGKAALHAVQGIGHATVAHFGMLLGQPGVKPDRMIHRFIPDASGVTMSNEAARRHITAVAGQAGVSPTQLEHAIWAWQREQDEN